MHTLVIIITVMVSGYPVGVTAVTVPHFQSREDCEAAATVARQGKTADKVETMCLFNNKQVGVQ